MNIWEIVREKEKDLWIFLYDDRKKHKEFDTPAHDHAVKSLNKDQIPVIIIIFPEEDEFWYDVKAMLSRHSSYMLISCGNMVGVFGSDEKGLTEKDAKILKERFQIDFEVTENHKFIFIFEYKREWLS